MSIQTDVKMTLTVTETVALTTTPFVTSAQYKATHSGLNLSRAQHATSSPTATTLAQGELDMVAGAATLDLTAAAGTAGAVNLNGLKPRQILIQAKTGNANPVTIAKGASNGYTGFGASFSITLQPGQRVMIDDNGAGTAVSGTVKTLDVSGTGTQGINYIIVGGA
jgi:hypothetical protein